MVPAPTIIVPTATLCLAASIHGYATFREKPTSNISGGEEQRTQQVQSTMTESDGYFYPEHSDQWGLYGVLLKKDGIPKRCRWQT